jgi:nicotinamide-nucleotide adenylyltransferase
MKAVFVGRFQPFHKGHLKVVERYSDKYEVEVVIADAGSRTRDNPLGPEERRDIIEQCIDHEVRVQQDFPDNDGKWAEQLVNMTGADSVITRNDWTRKAVAQNTDVEIIEQELHRRSMYSGTEVRTRIRSGDEWRYLVPQCCVDEIEKNLDKIESLGIDYEFEPGWKPENARN